MHSSHDAIIDIQRPSLSKREVFNLSSLPFAFRAIGYKKGGYEYWIYDISILFKRVIE